jgi:hypothetical protein
MAKCDFFCVRECYLPSMLANLHLISTSPSSNLHINLPRLRRGNMPDSYLSRTHSAIRLEYSKVGAVTTSLNVATLIISLVALAISSFFAIRQIGTARNANQLPVMNDILGEIRSPKFRQQEELLWDKLPALGKDIAYSQLPGNLREAADSVCLTYLMLAYVVSLRIVDRKLAVVPVHYRVAKTWEAVSPFVAQERKLRGDEYAFLNLLESFVNFIGRQHIQRIVEDLNGSFK